jgi:Zn-dependent protease
MQCHYCEEYKPGLPFRCNFCGNYFCSDHRLPENHACPRVGGPKQPGYSKEPSLQERYAKSHGHFGTLPKIGGRSGFRLRYPGVFSKAERKHILVATGLIVAVGLSMIFFEAPPRIPITPVYLLIGIVGFVLAFLGHEMAHKLFAQRNGLWAEFRTNVYGLILTALSILPIPIKFLAPGQVNIVGESSRELQGAIGLIGPGFNIVFGMISIFVGILFGHSDIGYAFYFIGAFNGYMALFNLIPFMGFDGLKAFEWDRTRWAISLIGSIALVASGTYLLGFLP